MANVSGTEASGGVREPLDDRNFHPGGVCLVTAVTASPVEYVRTVTAAMKLTVEEAQALEERLATDASDLGVRSQLVVYHHRHGSGDPSSRAAHTGHVLWLIRNTPEAGILGTPHGQIDSHSDAEGYIAGKDAWASHLEREPTNLAFLGHAASFYSPFQDRDMLIETLEKAHLLDPGNFRWPMELGHLYLRDSASAERASARLQTPEGLERRALEQAASAGRALEHLRRAYELADSDPARTFLLEGLAKAAFRAGHYGDARTYAEAMLTAPSTSTSRNDESHIHKANIVLGRLALLEDDIASAKHHLLAAGRVSGAPTLGSFGPNMRLARDLLERGERDVVLEYFELCANFWSSEKLEDWAVLVRGGRRPDFGANLVY